MSESIDRLRAELRELQHASATDADLGTRLIAAMRACAEAIEHRLDMEGYSRVLVSRTACGAERRVAVGCRPKYRYFAVPLCDQSAQFQYPTAAAAMLDRARARRFEFDSERCDDGAKLVEYVYREFLEP